MSEDILAELRSDVLRRPWYDLPLSVDRSVIDRAAAEIELLRAEQSALKAAAREFLTTLGAAIKTGEFEMNGSDDMCAFVRQALQKLHVRAFDREEERLHEEAKP
jgi:hypothetical protein